VPPLGSARRYGNDRTEEEGRKMARSSYGRRGRRARLGVGVVVAGLIGATAADAGATLRVANHNDPAGNPTVISYQFDSPDWTTDPIAFTLHDGEARSFGPGPGTYTVQAIPPSGWRVNSIQCVGKDQADFVIDVPNGLVTITHIAGAEQTCAFTNGEVTAPPSSGVAPSPPPGELPEVDIPREIALLGVRARKGLVAVRLRLIRRSTINLQLHRGTRVLARKRVFRRAGTRTVKVRLRPATRRWFRERGHKRVLFSLRARVAERNGAKKVFWYRVIVPL
jgi:hypothetical protein